MVVFYYLFITNMKNLKKSLISTLKEIKNSSNCLYDEQVAEIMNLCNEFMSETQDWKLEECFYDFLDYDIAEDYVKNQIQEGGLARIPYLCGNVDFWHYNYFKLNAYGNLENIDKDDVECLIDEIIDRLEE